MRTVSLITLSLLFVGAVSCIDKDPSWDISWNSGNYSETDSEPPVPPSPENPKDTTSSEEHPVDSVLLDAFSQDFSTSDTAPFTLGMRSGSDDFRYYPGFPSLSEANTDILMLRLDPADTPSEGPSLVACAQSFYGSYSIRLRTPDLSRIRKTTDAALEFRLAQAADGGNTIALRVEFRSPGTVTLNSEQVLLPQGCDPSVAFLTFGWDWTPDGVSWWIQKSSTKDKTVIKEISGSDKVPAVPGTLSLAEFHTADAPEYPFETEIDAISYEPFDDLIQEWKDNHFD